MIKRKSVQDKAMLALKSAIKDVVEKHKKNGRSLAVWANGRVQRISASTLRKKQNR